MTKKRSGKNTITITLLILIAVCLAIIGYAYSKYKEGTEGTTEATVAKWSFKVNESEDGAQTFYLENTINPNEHVAAEKVAPGTNGYFDLRLDGRGSETAINYIINANFENKPQNMDFYLDENYTTKLAVEDGAIIINGFIPLAEINSVKNVRIYWNWPIETGNTEEEIFKNNLIDTESTGKEIKMEQ